MFDGLVVAVEQLRGNEESDVWTHTSKQIRRELRAFYRKQSRNILPDPAAKCRAKKRGDPLDPLRRCETSFTDIGPVDAWYDSSEHFRAGYIQAAPGQDIGDPHVELCQQLFIESSAIEFAVYRLRQT